MIAAHLTWLLSVRGGGIPPVVVSLAGSQRRLGADTRVLAIRDPRADAIADAVTVRAFGPLALGWAPRLALALKEATPDLVHLHGLFTLPSHAARVWGRRTRRPVVISPHGMLEPWALAHSAWKKRVFRWAIEDDNLRRAACVHALCVTEASNMRALGVTTPIAIVPNGVDPPQDQAKGLASTFERRHPRTAGRHRLLFLGRIHPKKGLLNLITAWAAARKGAPEAASRWILVIAGPDQLGHRAEVTRRVRECLLERDVLFTGPLYGDAKEEALAAASAFILPSFSEGFSIAVLEAMSRQVPVLVTRQCNLDVEAFGGGILSDPTPDSLSRQLLTLFDLSDGERREMGVRASREVERRYTWRRIAADMMAVYGWVLGGNSAPASVKIL